jgi:hypothetical protein
MTRLRIDGTRLAEWSRTLDALPALGPQLAADPWLESGSLPATAEGTGSAVELDRIHTDAMCALVDAVAAIDTLTAGLSDAVRATIDGYVQVDHEVASMRAFE